MCQYSPPSRVLWELRRRESMTLIPPVAWVAIYISDATDRVDLATLGEAEPFATEHLQKRTRSNPWEPNHNLKGLQLLMESPRSSSLRKWTWSPPRWDLHNQRWTMMLDWILSKAIGIEGQPWTWMQNKQASKQFLLFASSIETFYCYDYRASVQRLF